MRGEVQRELGDPGLAEQPGGLDDHELRQPVGGVALAAHEPQRRDRPSVDRHEVQEAADSLVAVPRDEHERVGDELVRERVVGHAEPALGRTVAPVIAHQLELRQRGGRQVGDRAELRGVAVPRNPVDRLAQALAAPAGQIHHAGPQHRLVAEVEMAHARRAALSR